MKKKISLKLMLVILVLVPMIVVSIGLAVASIRTISSKLEENTLEELLVACQGLERYYGYDLANNSDLEGGFVEYNPEEYIDKVHDPDHIFLRISVNIIYCLSKSVFTDFHFDTHKLKAPLLTND